jgi:Cu(I)/Ag(I) efflux system membrane fusion protein
MKTKNIFIFVLLIIAVAGWFILKPTSLMSHKEATQKEIYYCPMHPHYTSDHPGNCPICGMKLVKKESSENSAQKKSPIQGYGSVSIDLHKQQLIGIKTISVETKDLTKTIHAYGYVAHDLELYEAELEYIDAWRVFYAYLSRKPIDKNYRQNWREYYINPPKENRWRSDEKVKAQERLIKSEYELIHMGLSDTQLEQLRQIPYGQPWVQPDLIFFEKNQPAWIYAQVPESDLGFLAVGQKVIATIPAYNETTEGVIKSIAPVVDTATRTSRIRIQLPKYRSELSVNMFVNVDIPVELDTALVIPREAVMDTGIRKIVFVQQDDQSFEPREIKTGFEGDQMIVVKSGLKEGEKIVSSGNFLLDSESRLQASVGGAQ